MSALKDVAKTFVAESRSGNINELLDAIYAADVTVPNAGPVVSIQIVISNGDVDDVAVGVGLTDIRIDVMCFTAGTRLRTHKGFVPIEQIEIGDWVNTKGHGFQPVVWI